jgi:uncharacterized delta-60 repeat protein
MILAVAVAALLLFWTFPVTVHSADGDLDLGFGDGGKIVADLDRGSSIQAIALQTDGKIVGVGFMDTKKKEADFAVGRLLAEGTPDPAFGDEGLTGLDFFQGQDVAYAIAIQPDGKIIAAGEANNPSTASSDFALARFNPDGSLDESFGDDGALVTDFAGRAEHVFALGLQDDGKIIAAGFTDTIGGDDDFALARYNANGTPDGTFGTEGKLHTDFLSGSRDVGYAMAIQPDGKIVVAGLVSGNFGLARYNKDGSLDMTFGYYLNGMVNIDFAAQYDLAYALALMPDGKILVAGYAYNQDGTQSDFALARFDSDGKLDPSFGSDGRIMTDFLGGMDSACAVAVQPDGKIVATGYATLVAEKDFALARYNDDGSPDDTFGISGKTSTDFYGQDDWAWGTALTPNGRIVVAGYATNAEKASMAIACYTAFAVTLEITGAEVRGKKLYVYGKNFDMDAELLMNGEKQKKTSNDDLNPSSLLITKKAGKKIGRGETVTLQVRNPDGRLSNVYSFTRPVE